MSVSEAQSCPNCDAAIKSGVFSNALWDARRVDQLNALGGTPLPALCDKCGPSSQGKAAASFDTRRKSEKAHLERLLQEVPIASIQSPADWDYRVLGLVTAQSVTGTGMFSDVASAFTDLFGSQSGTYNTKIRAGEDLCRASLRVQAIDLGGNAVIATDVDYAEVGGQRAMLMVCMTGTAVKLRNPDVYRSDYAGCFDNLTQRRASYAAMLKAGQQLGLS